MSRPESPSVPVGADFSASAEKYFMAQEMRVLFCALVTAHKRNDNSAFWATVDIAKVVIGQHANFNEEDWALFRRDTPRTDS